MRSALIRGAGIATLGFVLSRAITFGGYAAVAGLVSAKAVGQFTAGTVVVGMALLFAESGMLGAVVQWRGDVDEAASTAFVSTLASGLSLTLLAAAVSPLIGAFFHSSTAGEIAAVSSGFLFLRSLAIVPDALLQRRMSFLRRVAIDPLGAAAFTTATILAAVEDMGAWSLVVGTYALYGFEVVAAWSFARWRPRRSQMSMATWRRLAGFARHVVASEIVRRVSSQLDAILLGRFAGAATLGQYSYGLRLASQPLGAFVSIGAYILYPAFARVAEDPVRFRRGFEDSVATITLVALPTSVLLLLLGDQLSLLAFGPRWGPAGDAIKALSLAGTGYAWGSVCSEAFKAAGRPQLVTRYQVCALLLAAVLMPSLLWGDEVGMGIAVSAVAVLSGAYALRHGAAVAATTVGELVRRMRGSAGAALVALAAGGALDLTVFGGAGGRGGAAVAIVAETAVVVAAYLAALRLLEPREAARLGEMLRVLRRRSPVEA
jgi:PST family polysaccharide transporter